MTVGRICSRNAQLAGLEESCQLAAKRMKETNVGTLVVVDAKRRPIGIVTDRDLVLRVMARGIDPWEATVGQVMTAHPRWVGERTPIGDAVTAMRTLGVRRLPVVDLEERLVGIVTADDVLEFVSSELSNLGQLVGCSHQGVAVPALLTRAPRKAVPDSSGLQKALTDMEC
jgi:CBS-domain-containing membrane protein